MNASYDLESLLNRTNSILSGMPKDVPTEENIEILNKPKTEKIVVAIPPGFLRGVPAGHTKHQLPVDVSKCKEPVPAALKIADDVIPTLSDKLDFRADPEYKDAMNVSIDTGASSPAKGEEQPDAIVEFGKLALSLTESADQEVQNGEYGLMHALAKAGFKGVNAMTEAFTGMTDESPMERDKDLRMKMALNLIEERFGQAFGQDYTKDVVKPRSAAVDFTQPQVVQVKAK